MDKELSGFNGEMNNIQLFYGWWEFSVCFFAFLGLMSIWFHIGRNKKDYGQVWLAISILCWSFSGLVEVLDAYNYNNHSKFFLDGWRSIFSLFNSLFILIALPWFKYIPTQLESIIKSKYWPVIVGLPFVFSLLPTLTKMFLDKGYGLISELDVYYSILTLIFLGIILFQSFNKRRLPLLAYLAIVSLVITFLAQILKLNDNYVGLILFSSIFKTTLIMIFFALALSWVKELVDYVIPIPEELELRLFKNKIEGETQNIIEIKGISPNKKLIYLPISAYNLVAMFISKKIDNQDEGWLELKPKLSNQQNKSYDIQDYNEVKRLLTFLLNGIYGKDNWSKNHHYIPIKEALLETSKNRDRKIRLKVPIENLSISNYVNRT